MSEDSSSEIGPTISDKLTGTLPVSNLNGENPTAVIDDLE